MRAIVFILWVYSHAVIAQCNLILDSKDEFTGAHNTEVWGQLQSDLGGGATLTFRQIDDRYLVKLTISQGGANALVVGVGDQLMLKLANDSIVKLPSVEVASGTFSSQYGTTTTILECNYEASASQILALSEFVVVRFRVYLSNSYIEKDCKAKHAAGVQQAAKCILTKPWRP